MDAIPRKAVRCLGIAQLVCWGVTYYLIGIFGDRIGTDLGWSETMVQGGYSVALLVMGFASPPTGRCIDRFGGRPVLATGSALASLGCMGLATTTAVTWYYLSWVVLGTAMRCTLYDAAFATLAGLSGSRAKRPMSQITLLGGLASTVFWPIGHGLAELVGWRGALVGYTVFALLTLPLHLALPSRRYVSSETHLPTTIPDAAPSAGRGTAGLYALIMAGAGFLGSGMSAHLIGVLTGLGLAVGTAVWVSTLRGIAQSAARLAEVLLGQDLSALDLNVISVALLMISFLVGFGGGQLLGLAAACAALYGAGNGLATITRGTLPLALFTHRGYGALVGRLLLPSFLLSAAAPLAYAVVIEDYGAIGALTMSTTVAAIMVAAALTLRIRFRRQLANSSAEGVESGLSG